MRGCLALVLIVAVGCQAGRAPASQETHARLPGRQLVSLPRLAEDLDLDYRGQGRSGGVIELSAPPDHVMLVKDSHRALINGHALAMQHPCMRRGDDFVLAVSDAVKVSAALARIRSTRTEPVVLAVHRSTGTSTRRSTGDLPAAWRPGAGVTARDWRAIVIHHTATTTGSASLIDLLHKRRGWQGLGYHFVIGNGTLTGDGQVEVGRRWKAQMHGAHARVHEGDNNYWNLHSIGIGLVGDFRGRAPSSAQMNALVRLVKALQTEYQIPVKSIKPHRHVSRTLCPGPQFPWNEFLARLR